MSDDVWKRNEIESPCVKVCVLQPETRICFGCYRTGDEIDEILDGNRNCLWLLGTRRMGKTSTLKEAELRASAAGSAFVPLFWDLQGADEPAENGVTQEELQVGFEADVEHQHDGRHCGHGH